MRTEPRRPPAAADVARRTVRTVGVRLPDPCLVVLVGVAGAGKSTWAQRWFEPAAIVSADDLRAVVGHHRHDLRATKDATEVLELIVDQAPAPRPAHRDRLHGARSRRPHPLPVLAAPAGVACHAVVVDTPERETRARNRSRPEAVRRAVVTSQLKALPPPSPRSTSEPFAGVHRVSDGDDVTIVPRSLYDAPAAARPTGGSHDDALRPPARRLVVARRRRRAGAAARRHRPHRRGGRLLVDLGDGPLPPDPAGRPGVGGHAREHDHARLPRRRHQHGSASARSSHGVTYRNLAHLAKIVATLDVLSGRPGVLRPRRGLVRARARRSTAGTSRPSPAATTCSRTPCSCCR